MKRWKLVLGTALLLCLVVALMAMPAFGASIVESGTCGSNLTWALDSNGVLTISGTGEMWDYEKIENNDSLAEEDNYCSAPWGRKEFSSLRIEEGVTSIGEYAFAYCEHFTTVSIAKTVTNIGVAAFRYCDVLQRFQVDAQNPNYANDAKGVLFNKGMTTLIQAPGRLTGEYNVPAGTTTIGEDAFCNCDSVTSIILPSSVTVLERGVFYSCGNLINVTLPDSITSIGSYSFENCTNLPTLVLPEGITSIEKRTFYNCSSLTHLVFPSGLSRIGYEAFRKCDALTYVTLPERLSSIEGRAFRGCSSLVSVTLPEGLTSVREYAFAECSSLQHLIFLGNAPAIGSGIFSGTSPVVYYPERNTTWTADVKLDYDGDPTYKALGTPSALAVEVAEPYPYYFTGDTIKKEDVTATLRYNSGAASLLLPSQFTLTTGDMSSPGVKSLTVSAKGVSSTFSLYVHDGAVIVPDRSEWPESAHDYSNNLDNTQTLRVPCAEQIKITFSNQTSLESGYDDLYVYDGDGTLIAEYTALQAAGKTLTIQGDTVKIRLTTDGSVVRWGYALSSVEATRVEHVYETAGSNCAICGTNYIASPHSYDSGTITTRPGCTTTGIKTYSCDDCGHSYTEVLPATGHNWVDGDCTTPKHCTNCGETQGTTSGHAYDSGRVTTSASCENAGVRTYTCSKCGHSYTESIPAYGHDWTAATCTSAKRCNTCGTTSGTALGHSYRIVRNEPTCTESGSEVSTCTRCGIQTTTVLPSTGHNWVDADCMTPRHCADCGLSSGSALGHRMVEASCELPSHCTYCGLADGEPLGHNYLVTTGVCSRCSETAPFTVEAPQMEYCYGSTQEKVRAQWTKVEGIDGYELYMSTDPDDLRSFELVKSVKDPDTLTYTKGGLTPGVTYYFRVCAYVLLEDELTRVRSPLSNVKYCMPTVLWDSPYSNSDFRIRLRWEQVEGAAGYQIWREGEGEAYRVVKTVKDGLATAYSNVGLVSGGIYTYKMRAYFINEDGTRNYGTFSDEVTVGVQPSKPSIVVTSPRAGRAQVDWEWLHGASAYQVWMSESPDGGFKIVKSIYDGDVTSYTKTGLVSGKTYYFKVRASVEVDGKKSFGAYSNTIAVTVK